MKYHPNFKKLRVIFNDKLRQDWVGDWDLKTNRIMISDKLRGIDKFGVIVHEFIEMMAHAMLKIPDCCQREYSDKKYGKKNLLAHNIANQVERRLLELGGYSWEAHQRRIRKNKEGDMD